MYEIDLRFLDVIRMTNWGVKSYWARSAENPDYALLITHWPLSVSLYDPAIGYRDHAIPSRNARTWEDVAAIMAERQDMSRFYVFTVQPIGDLLPRQRAAEFGFELVRERTDGELTGELYLRTR